MALSKEWKARYLKELSSAISRAEKISELKPGWHFNPYKTMPKTDYQAAQRITELRRVTLTNIERGSAPRNVVYQVDTSFDVPSAGFERGFRVNRKSAPLTSAQYAKAKRAERLQAEVYKEMGLKEPPQPFMAFSNPESVKNYIKARRSRRVIMQNVTDSAQRFKRNFLKSLSKQADMFMSYGMENNYTLAHDIIRKVRGMGDIEVSNILAGLKDRDVSMSTELLGSETNVLSESNLGFVAEAFDVPTNEPEELIEYDWEDIASW